MDSAAVAGGVVVHQNPVHNISGIEQFNQLAGALKGGKAVVGVKALFIAGGGICAHSLVPCRCTDGGAVEASRFKNNGGGVVHNSTELAAHNASDSNRLFGIGYNQLL